MGVTLFDLFGEIVSETDLKYFLRPVFKLYTGGNLIRQKGFLEFSTEQAFEWAAWATLMLKDRDTAKEVGREKN